MKRLLGLLLLAPVYFYRWFISPLTGPSCQHTPTCSQYAIDAIGIPDLEGFLLRYRQVSRVSSGWHIQV
ncbi:MAG: membrane protein insertion efficiency factor YidD [Bacteroidales bacterium]